MLTYEEIFAMFVIVRIFFVVKNIFEICMYLSRDIAEIR